MRPTTTPTVIPSTCPTERHGYEPDDIERAPTPAAPGAPVKLTAAQAEYLASIVRCGERYVFRTGLRVSDNLRAKGLVRLEPRGFGPGGIETRWFALPTDAGRAALAQHEGGREVKLSKAQLDALIYIVARYRAPTGLVPAETVRLPTRRRLLCEGYLDVECYHSGWLRPTRKAEDVVAAHDRATGEGGGK